VFLVPEEYALAKDIYRDHLLRPHRSLQRFAFLREALARGDVKVVLVFQAAKEPATASGDLRWVEREMLILGEAKIHR